MHKRNKINKNKKENMKTKWKETMEKMWNAGIILIPPPKKCEDCKHPYLLMCA